jgi:hypothetical protein
MDAGLTLEDLQHAIDRVVGNYLEGMRIYRPPVDWVDLAQSISGIRTEVRDEATGLGRKRAASQGKLLLGESLREESRQRLAAQTIAHSLIPQVGEALGAETGEKLPSAWVRILVERLMVPPGWFREVWREVEGNLSKALDRFEGTPIDLVAQRLLDSPEPTVLSIVDHGALVHRASNGPRLGKTLWPLEKECLAYVANFSRARRMSQGGMTVWCWPIHKSDWKKEILRTVVSEDGDGPGLDI